MTEEDKQILDNKSNKELAFIWTEINHYKCPDIFNHYKEEIERLSKLSIRGYEKDNIISSLMRYIESKIPYKLILKVANKNLSEKEFEDFWKGNYENDLEAKERDSIRTLKIIAKKYNIFDSIDWNLPSKSILEFMEREIK